MKTLYKAILLSLFMACNQLDASNFKISNLLSFAAPIGVEFEALSEKDTWHKSNKLHTDVANLDSDAIIALIKSGRDLDELFSDKNEIGQTPYDQAKQGAMNHYWPPKTRKQFYVMCKMFETIHNEKLATAPSTVILKSQPTDAIMMTQYESAMNSIIRPAPYKKDHLKKS